MNFTKIISGDRWIYGGLFLLALLPRIWDLSGHGLFVDELFWMIRGKQAIFAYKQFNWSFFEQGWWFKDSAVALGLPVTIMVGIFETLFARGQSSISLGLLSDIVASRLPIVIIGSSFVPLFYWFVKQWFDKKLALVAAVILALDPLSIALSRWAHQDLFLGVVIFLSLGFYLKRGSKNFILSCFFMAAAALTKPQAAVLPVALLVYATAFSKNKFTVIKKLFLWGIISGLMMTVVFPYLWKNPIGQYWKYANYQREVVSEGHITIYQGEAVTNPPWYYYLSIIPLHMTEAEIVGIIFAIGFFAIWLGKKRYKNKNKNRDMIIISGIMVLIYLILVSFSGKKLGVRYIYPIWPYLMLIASYGLYLIINYFSDWQKKVLITALIFLPSVLGLLTYAPSYYLYHNNLVSSAQNQYLELVGVCDGSKPAIEYLGDRVKNAKILFLGCPGNAQYYTGYTLNKAESLADDPDLIVAEPNYLTRNPETERVLKEEYETEKSLWFAGFELARVYKRSNL